MKLQGKRILLTGANGGIGSVLSRMLAAQGVRLVLCSINEPSLNKLVSDIAASGVENDHHVIAGDISNVNDRQHIAQECERLGGIDVLINLAGILDFRMFEDQQPLIIEKILQVNLVAPALLTHALLPMLKSREEAVILNVGSVFGSIGHPGFVIYCTSKSGMKTFTESLSRELADTGVRVSYISPRATATALNNDRVNAMNEALGNRMDAPEFVAQQIVMQLQNDKSLNYLGWPEKFFVKVNAVLPTLVHKALVKNLSLIKHFARS